MSIESREATEALADIEQIADRVRQSRFYNFASLILILWGALVFAGYLLSYMLPRQAGMIWIAIDLLGVIGSVAISLLIHEKSGVRTFDGRAVAAMACFFAFGLFWSVGMAHFGPRELNAFWTTFFMLPYTMVGFWLGWAFVAIGLGITALTLIGYYWSGPYFELWMAVVNGGGLMLGGLWMRRS
jgi:hypothetical protein